jgi:hypothetical protein
MPNDSAAHEVMFPRWPGCPSLTVLINTMYYAPIFNCFVKELRGWGLRPNDLSNTCR